MNKPLVNKIVFGIACIGAANWGILTLFKKDLVMFLPAIAQPLVYIGVGIAGGYSLFKLIKSK